MSDRWCCSPSHHIWPKDLPMEMEDVKLWKWRTSSLGSGGQPAVEVKDNQLWKWRLNSCGIKGRTAVEVKDKQPWKWRTTNHGSGEQSTVEVEDSQLWKWRITRCGIHPLLRSPSHLVGIPGATTAGMQCGGSGMAVCALSLSQWPHPNGHLQTITG